MEAVVAIVIAAVTGLGVLNTRLNNRLHELDRRIDTIEVKVAEDYVQKADLTQMMDRVEDHMVRIENKLDKLMFK
tara:strand:+ start:612 stop:836 length:225 start_codon:yes stop_codon:yes gene_type:complete